MSRETLFKILIPVVLLGTFLVGVIVVDRAQSAQEQAYLATATVYIPPTTTAAPPTTAPVKVPVFSVTDEEGTAYTLADFAGKPTVICFWNSGYAESRSELSVWEGILKEYEDRVNLVVVHVNSPKADMQAAMDCLKEEEVTFTPYFDLSGDTAEDYDVSIFPTTFFVNAQGELKARARGNIKASDLPTGLERIGLMGN